ncbi:MAG: 50S ribosomal protein L32 [candidate division Zixibacteria bacterium]|nr:50S ribosomal protein L32 [candidate division Zixibacteria bacterium]
MALPKRRQSKQRGRKRRTHYKISAPSLAECPNCNEMKLPHHICPYCGYYRGEKIIAGKED